jgi:hypothetical protein
MLKKTDNTTDDLLRDLMIVQLGLAGVPGQTIRKIVGCNMGKVTRIVKHLKKARGRQS